MNYEIVGLYEYDDVYQVVSTNDEWEGTVWYQGRRRNCAVWIIEAVSGMNIEDLI